MICMKKTGAAVDKPIDYSTCRELNNNIKKYVEEAK